MIDKIFLLDQYEKRLRSVKQIADELGCSENKVTYWLNRHSIKKRSISEAIYLRSNPAGDPFLFKQPRSNKEWFLYGLGLGLFWGEGNKVNKHSVRLGNVDPELINYFVMFLNHFYQIDKNKLRFGLQVFSDIDPHEALDFWIKHLKVSRASFHKKIIVSPSKKIGTYKRKSRYGVLTVYFSNSKLRDNIIAAIEQLRVKEKPS